MKNATAFGFLLSQKLAGYLPYSLNGKKVAQGFSMYPSNPNLKENQPLPRFASTSSMSLPSLLPVGSGTSGDSGVSNKQVNRVAFQFHPYHLVDPSPWPLITSFALLTLTLSAVMYFNGYALTLNSLNVQVTGGTLVLLGFLATLFAMILWFRDVAAEGSFMGNHTFAVQKGLNLGVALFIVSEVFFFISIFWAYFHSALAPTVELGAHWPPAGIDPLNPFEIPLLNTIILLSSGATVTYAHHSLIQGNRKGVLLGIILTVVLALVFTGLQGLEYYEAPFTISDSVYGSTFYMATGFHGLHVIIGTLFISVSFFRILSYHLTDHHHLGFESSILYWHFVDVVWLFLYVSIYWWGA